MAALNQQNIDTLIKRLESIDPDAKPKWGTMDKEALIEHLLWAVNASMNPNTALKFMGNFLTTTIVGPLIIRGIIPFPKNVKLPSSDGTPPNTRTPGDINDLRAAMEKYVANLENGTLETPGHPVFGELGPKGWAMMHVQHFEHHFKQFGV